MYLRRVFQNKPQSRHAAPERIASLAPKREQIRLDSPSPLRYYGALSLQVYQEAYYETGHTSRI